MSVRIAVFGDLSGHLQPLEDALTGLGAASGAWPGDLTVIQVGDLVHKGPDGHDVVAYVDRLMARAEGRWVQLLGNHEGMHLGGPRFVTTCTCSAATLTTLNRWVSVGSARLAVGVESDQLGPVLVTHAGLSFDAWSAIGVPREVGDAAGALNATLDRPAVAFRPGRLLWRRGGAGLAAAVTWADSLSEVYPSWQGRRAPFSQIHGHTSAVRWDDGQLSAQLAADVASTADVDLLRRHLRVRVGGAVFVGVDPGFGRAAPGRTISPLVLSGRLVADGVAAGRGPSALRGTAR